MGVTIVEWPGGDRTKIDIARRPEGSIFGYEPVTLCLFLHVTRKTTANIDLVWSGLAIGRLEL